MKFAMWSLHCIIFTSLKDSHVPGVDFITETSKASVLPCIVAILACLQPEGQYGNRKVLHSCPLFRAAVLQVAPKIHRLQSCVKEYTFLHLAIGVSLNMQGTGKRTIPTTCKELN